MSIYGWMRNEIISVVLFDEEGDQYVGKTIKMGAVDGSKRGTLCSSL